MITTLMIQKLVMEGIRVDRVIVFASLLGIVQERKYNNVGWIEGKKPMYNGIIGLGSDELQPVMVNILLNCCSVKRLSLEVTSPIFSP